MNNLYIGFMSGTSCDGVDASLVETDGCHSFRVIHNIAINYPNNFKKQLKQLCLNQGSFLSVEKELTNYHIKAAKKLLTESKHTANQIKAIGFHGQSIYHEPESGLTWQIGNPHLLATKLNIPVIHDFRRRDIAYGGQGAPLIPIFHKLLIRGCPLPSAIINIGGVANLTFIDDNSLIAFDTGMGNALIDDMMVKFYKKPYDADGKIAQTGSVDKEFINKALCDKFFNTSYPKSLDRNYFKYLLKELKNKKPQDVVASLAYLTSASIAHGFSLLPRIPKEVFICGGGANNTQIINWLNKIIKTKYNMKKVLDISNIKDMNSNYIESQGFAYLAARFINNLPSAFPDTTGAKISNICGAIVFP